MAQYARPTGDIVTSVWTTTPLWSKIEEGSPGDDTRVVSDASPGSAEAFAVSLGSVTDPTSSVSHTIRAKWRNELTGVANVEMTCELRQDYVSEVSQGTLIGTLQVTITTEQTDQTDTYTLDGTETDSITDYTSLYLRCHAAKSGGGSNPQGGIDYIEFEVPDAASPPQTVNMDALNVSGDVRTTTLTTGAVSTILNLLSLVTLSQALGGILGQSFNMDFETNNLTGTDDSFDSSSGADISVAAAAALANTNYGVSILIDDAVADYGIRTFNWGASAEDLRIRFYIDPNNLTMGAGDAFEVVRITNEASPGDYVIRLVFDRG